MYQVELELTRVWGIGPTTARKLMNKGYHSIQALRAAIASNVSPCPLTPQQLIGLKHLEDIECRIPHDEVTEIAQIVADAAYTVFPGAQAVACGSYRRLKATSGSLLAHR